MILKRFRAIFHPEEFQGWGQRKNYFEGWYYKLINADGSAALAVIPGVAYNAAGEGHAFIQLLDGNKATSEYFKFPASDFIARSGKLDITIQENHFTEESVTLNLPQLNGSVTFRNTVPWPKTLYAPGIMGPYRYAPFMECYHGIVSMDHELEGSLSYKSVMHNFNKGRGYIEKDWGRSFPEAYVWMQSNHFEETGISVKASVAKIPWIGNAFTGFIAGLWLHNKLYRFTTYNRTKLLASSISSEKIHLLMENPHFRLEISALPDKSSALVSPINGAMEGKIEESMNSVINIILTERKQDSVIFQGQGKHAGVEIAGKIHELCS